MISPLRSWVFALTWASLHSCASPCGPPEPPAFVATYTIDTGFGDDRLIGSTVHIEGEDLTIVFTDPESNQTYAARYVWGTGPD